MAKIYRSETLQELKAQVNPVDILTSIGGLSFSDLLIGRDEIRCCCPLHLGDNKSAFSWKLSSGTWICFTKNCGTKNRDVFDFVSTKLGVSFYESVQHVARVSGFNLPDMEEENNSEFYRKCRNVVADSKLAKKYKIESLKELSYLPGYNKAGFDIILRYLESRNYDYNKLKDFKLYPSTDGFKFLRLGIPVLNDSGKVVGINARLMDTIMDYPKEIVDEEGKTHRVPKYRLSKYNKKSILYNLNNAKKTSMQEGLIIVEGQFDVMRLFTYGKNNAVCTMGTMLSTEQVALLYKNCFHVTFLIEANEAAEVGVLKSVKQIKPGMKVSIARLPFGDADNNPKQVVDYTLKHAIRLSKEDLKGIVEERTGLPT